MIMINKILVDNKSDIQKLIHIYVTILESQYGKLKYEELVNRLKLEFGLTVRLSDIQLYYEPNQEEQMQDTDQLINNLGIRYE